jgi:formamidopyrimidine-DNA glycosylase
MNEILKGKLVQRGSLGNSPHKFVWYNRRYKEFEKITKGKTIGEARAKGRWLFVDLKPGYVLLFGECGGRMLYHEPGASVSKKYHLYLQFEDDSFFTATTQMWGAFELYEKGKEQQRKYVKGMKKTPAETGFSFDYFCRLIDGLTEKKSVKGLLTQDQLIPGLGNAIAQDIMYRAQLHPRHPIDELTKAQKRRLHKSIMAVVHEVVRKGGRYDEYDLHGNPGKYVRLMDKNAVGKPCPKCGTKIEKIQFLGGACYFCRQCQQ